MTSTVGRQKKMRRICTEYDSTRDRALKHGLHMHTCWTMLILSTRSNLFAPSSSIKFCCKINCKMIKMNVLSQANGEMDEFCTRKCTIFRSFCHSLTLADLCRPGLTTMEKALFCTGDISYDINDVIFVQWLFSVLIQCNFKEEQERKYWKR